MKNSSEVCSKSNSFSLYLFMVKLPLQGTNCCMLYARNWDILPCCKIAPWPFDPPAHTSVVYHCGFYQWAVVWLCLWDRTARKNVDAAKCNRMQLNFLVFLAYCIWRTVSGHAKSFSGILNNMGNRTQQSVSFTSEGLLSPAVNHVLLPSGGHRRYLDDLKCTRPFN